MVQIKTQNYLINSHAMSKAIVTKLHSNSGLAGGAATVTGEITADIIRK